MLADCDLDGVPHPGEVSVLWHTDGVLVLRHHRHDQEYKTPPNLRIFGREIPAGLMVTTAVLLLVAIANLFSKKFATIYGVGFTVVFFIIFFSAFEGGRRVPNSVVANATWWYAMIKIVPRTGRDTTPPVGGSCPAGSRAVEGCECCRTTSTLDRYW